MRTVGRIAVFLGALSLFLSACGSGAQTDAAVFAVLRGAGATQYGETEKPGGGLERLLLGYNEAGEAVVGVAVRKTKTYKKVTTLIAVKPTEGKYTISQAEIPDLDVLPGESRTMTADALTDITGKVFVDAKSTKGLVDAVSGATKYYKAIYVSYGLMASRVIKAMADDPDWPKKPVPPADAE